MFRSCCSSVVTLTSPETAATMITMTVIESISFRARRRGIIDIRTYIYYITSATVCRKEKLKVRGRPDQFYPAGQLGVDCK